MTTSQDQRRLLATDISVERGGRLVIADLSFSVTSGEALLLTGPNGAGKTTLIRALAGLIPIHTGTFDFVSNENPATTNDLTIGEQCHYIGHANAAKPELTVRENLAFWARFMGSAIPDDTMAMRELGLLALADIPVRYLSAGQQRRVALARLRVAKRQIWLLDEPTVSLDSANSQRLIALGDAHLASGGIIVAATHIPLEFQPHRKLRLKPVDAEADRLSYADAAPSAEATP